MIKNIDVDFIMLNLEIITENVKTCIKKSSNISYLNEYKETIFILLDILDSADLIGREISKSDKSEPE